MAMVMKRAVMMAMKVAGKDEGDGNGAKRAIARKRAMASNNNNKMTATETTTQHCPHHRCPCFSHCGSSLCLGALAAADIDWWRRMRTKVGAWDEGGLCVEV
jgi:hypothetical protein